MRSRVLLLAVALAAVVPLEVPGVAAADAVTYSATQTIPVPPASDYAGSGGGDGWAIELSDTEVFNVFHHSGNLTVACHLQADASSCWAPRTITDPGGGSFATNGHPEMWLDQATGELHVLATRSADGTAGVVCVDTTVAATNPNPFCGFVALTPVGEGPVTPSGTSGVSNGMLVGDRWFAFSYVHGAGVAGARNTLLCFDTTTKAPCDGQPYAVAIGPGTVETSGFPQPATAAIGTRLVLPIRIAGEHRLACFDVVAMDSCGGAFPVTLGFAYAEVNGSPFPALDASGELTGFCLPTSAVPCFDLTGASMATPAGLAAAMEASSPWSGPAFVLGPRVYVPIGGPDRVVCFSFASGGPCANFPKSFTGLSYLYSVNSDPQRPTYIWVNADGGASQIQSFDAFTGKACDQGTTRVLASQFVVALKQCEPATYTSLRILEPERAAYTDGVIQFADADGNAIPGAADRSLDATGAVDLRDLQLNTATGLPQFLITLDGGAGSPSQVVVELTWTGERDPACGAEPAAVALLPPPAAPVVRQPAPVTATAPSVTPQQQEAPGRRCLSRRRFRIRIVTRRRDPVRRATVRVAGKKVAVRKRRIGGRRRLVAIVDLRGLERDVVTIRIRATLRSGKVVTGKRRYKTCTPKERGGRPRL